MFTPTLHSPTLKLAFIRTSSIGDVVLATACLNLLSKLKMPKEVFWIGRRPSISLIEAAFPDVTTVPVQNFENNLNDSQAKRLSEVHLIVDLQKNIRSRFISSTLTRLSGAPHFTWNKEGFKRNRLILQSRLLGRSQTLSSKFTHPSYFKYQMMLEPLINGLSRQLPVEMRDGIDIDAPPFLPTAHDHGDRPWQKELKFGHWIAVAPGASYPTKQAPMTKFLEVLQNLRAQWQTLDQNQQNGGLGLLLLGDENDRRICTELIGTLSWPYATLNLAGKLSLWETALALKEARVLLTNDSSLGHIAEAVETPTAVLFGPTVEGFGFAPRKSDSEAFSIDLGCRPCSKHGKTPCRFGDHLCFTALESAPIADFLLKAVAKKEVRL